MKKILCLSALAFLMVSCVTRKTCERKFQAYQADSVLTVTNIVTVIRDTTIYVRLPGDTVFETVPIDDVSILSTGMATSSAWVKDGKLKHKLETRDTSIGVQFRGALKTSSSSFERNRIIKQKSFYNQLSSWQLLLICLGKVFFITIIIVILYKTLKNYLRH